MSSEGVLVASKAHQNFCCVSRAYTTQSPGWYHYEATDRRTCIPLVAGPSAVRTPAPYVKADGRTGEQTILKRLGALLGHNKTRHAPALSPQPASRRQQMLAVAGQRVQRAPARRTTPAAGRSGSPTADPVGSGNLNRVTRGEQQRGRATGSRALVQRQHACAALVCVCVCVCEANSTGEGGSGGSARDPGDLTVQIFLRRSTTPTRRAHRAGRQT